MIQQGFYFKRVRVHGPNKPDAVVDFIDGLNIIVGASNTGKSYIFRCLDFCLCKKNLGKENMPEAVGYTHVDVTIIRRSDQAKITISRPVSGGGATATILKNDTETITKLPVNASISHPVTFSEFLLQQLGSDGKKIRKNEDGGSENLSIRDLAKLFLIDEIQIQGEISPVLSSVVMNKTKDTNVFRFLLSGRDDSDIVPSEKAAVRKDRAKNQLFIIEQIIASLSNRIKIATKEITDRTSDNSDINKAASIESIIDDLHNHLAEAKRAHHEAWTKDQDLGAELITKRSLSIRLQTLAKSYDIDLERLEASHQAALAMDELPAVDCALCGARPEHQIVNVAEAKSLGNIIPSIQAEIQNVRVLKEGLQSTLGDTQTEIQQILASKGVSEARLATATTAVQLFESELKSALHAVRQQSALIVLRSKVEAWNDDLIEHQEQRDRLVEQIDRKQEKQEFAGLSHADIQQISASIEDMLTKWYFPGSRSTEIDLLSLDAVVGGVPRASNGKGVRAVIHAAFSLALMENCLGPHSPHPQTVLLDSPLVAYKDPKDIDEKLRDIDLASYFYSDLAKRYAEEGQQVIIFENRDPPPLIQAHMEEFTRNSNGRYGFFPIHS